MPVPTPPFTLPSYGAPLTLGSVGSYTATIGGSLVNVKQGTVNIQNQVGQRSQGSMSVWSDLGVNWLYGTRTLIYDETGTEKYAGYVTKDKVYKAGSQEGVGYLEHDLQLMDNCYRADKRRVFKTYLNQTAGYIVNDLLNSYLKAEGVISVMGSIGAGIVITEVIWNGSKSVSDALTWLATQCGYWWQIDLNGVLWFLPYGGIPAPWVLDGRQAESVNQQISVEFGNDMYINRQYVKGSTAQTGLLTETFHGDGITRNFTLGYDVSKITSVLENGVNVTVKSLSKGSSGGYWYYAVGDAVIAQDPARTVLGSGVPLVVTYNGSYPVMAQASNSALISAQKAREGNIGTGLVESIYTNTKVRTLPAAFGIASSMLKHYGADTTVLDFSTRKTGLLPGQLLTVQLPDFGASMADRQMLISSVTITDQTDGFNIWFQVQAVGSPLESAQWQTYWANLMQQSSDPSDYTDTSDTALAILSPSVFTHSPSFTVTGVAVQSPICGVVGGPHTMVCGNWTVS
jgi:hypothetical protein